MFRVLLLPLLLAAHHALGDKSTNRWCISGQCSYSNGLMRTGNDRARVIANRVRSDYMGYSSVRASDSGASFIAEFSVRRGQKYLRV